MKNPPAVAAALAHVRTFCPDVVKVSFNSYGIWQYTTSNGVCPEFPNEVDVGILEDAMDEVDNTVGFPASFSIQ